MAGVRQGVVLGLLLISLICLESSAALTDIPSEPSVETALVRHLEERALVFGKTTRPKVNASLPTDVYFGFRLIQLDVDEKANVLHTSVWCRYRWYDEYLRWNASQFAGISRVVFPARSLWKPDVALVNTAETQVDERLSDVSLNSDGRIFWAPHRMYRSACLLDLTNYPFDSHKCSMWFQSLSYSDRMIQLHPYVRSPLDLDTYLSALKEAGDWEITSNTTQAVPKPREMGAILMYSRRNSLLFHVTLRRRAGFTTYLLTLPPVVLSVINSLVFCLPPERPDRHSLATSIFGSFMVLLLILVESAPPTSASVPVLGIFYAFNILLIIVSIFLSVLVVNTHTRGSDGQRPSPWMRGLLLRLLAKLLFIKAWSKCGTQTNSPQSEQQQQQQDQKTKQSLNPFHIPKPAESNMSLSWQQRLCHIETQLGSVETALVRTSLLGGADQGSVRLARAEWTHIAVVLDRLFFILYLIALVISIVCLYPQPN